MNVRMFLVYRRFAPRRLSPIQIRQNANTLRQTMRLQNIEIFKRLHLKSIARVYKQQVQIADLGAVELAGGCGGNFEEGYTTGFGGAEGYGTDGGCEGVGGVEEG